MRQKTGLTDPVNPFHLFILLWGATQFYADFGVMPKNGLGVQRLTRAHFDTVAENMARVVLKGCGIRYGPASTGLSPQTDRVRAACQSAL